MVCPGPCNPRQKSRNHHHHHHRHRHRHEEYYDTNESVGLAEEDACLPQDFVSATLLKPLELDAPSVSINGASISELSYAGKIPRPSSGTVGGASSRKILLQFRETSTAGVVRGESPPPATEETEATVAAATLNDAKLAIARGLNGLVPRRLSNIAPCLTIFALYVGIHALLAAIAWQTPASHFYVSSQICGILALLMWRTTGTILI